MRGFFSIKEFHMKNLLILTLVLVFQLKAMENTDWDVERMATRIGNQRRADDKARIKEFQAIAKKSYKDLTQQEEAQLNDLAWRHEHSCILELLCQSPLFKEKGMGLRKNLMLYFAVQEVAVGMHNSARRARVLKNVEILLKNGAAQDEAHFKSCALTYYVFERCGTTEKDFQVHHITKKDHLNLIGIFAKYVKHDTFKEKLKEELQKQKNQDHGWATEVAQVVIENGMDSNWVNAILK